MSDSELHFILKKQQYNGVLVVSSTVSGRAVGQFMVVDLRISHTYEIMFVFWAYSTRIRVTDYLHNSKKEVQPNLILVFLLKWN